MRGIILALSLVIVGSQQVHYEPNFSSKTTYIYKYEGVILTGLPEKDLARGGLKIICKVQISSMGQKIHLLKIISPQIQEYSGIWPKAPFRPAQKLTRRLTADLNKPVKFEYNRGRVGNIYAPADLPENILNIYRGILNILQISIKKTQNIYDLQEMGVEGICHTSYLIQEDKKAGQITITKSKDLNNCQEKASKTMGIPFTQFCESCQLKGKNLRSFSTYTYTMQTKQGGAEIVEVNSHETHQFTPFNEFDGGVLMEARQHLIFLDSTSQSLPTTSYHMENRGTLTYQFSNELLQMPVHLFKTSNNDTQIIEILENLVQNNQEKAHSDAPSKFLQLIQLLRSATYQSIQTIWKKKAPRPEYRRWILDTLPSVGTIEALTFVKTKIEEGALTQFEAAHILLFMLHSITPDCHGVDNATVLLYSPYIQRTAFLRRITLLAYGSLVKKYCGTIQVCAEETLQPLHKLLVEASSKSNEDDIVLALKAIGNAGHPASIKRIQKFLPGFGTGAAALPTRIQREAIMALRNIAALQPRKVEEITIQLFMNPKNHPEIRMMAFVVLFETKPSMASVAIITDSLIKETNLHVASFTYSFMKALVETSLPDLHSVATACNIAIKRLSPKCDQLSYRHSKALHFDTFKDKLLAGLEADFYLINNGASILPTSALAKFKVYGLGGTAGFLEVGIQAEGLHEAIQKSSSPERKQPQSDKSQRIMKRLSGWKSLPTTKPLGVAYIKLFGQEVAFVELNKNDIQEALKLFNNPVKKDALLMKLKKQLQQGLTTQWSKPLLATEVRHIVATGIGLPMDLSLHYSILTAVSVNAKAQFAPNPSSNVTAAKLLNSTIQLNVQVTPSVVKDITAILGINTQLIQTGVEMQVKTRTIIPLDFTAKVNLKDKNINFETSPLQQEDYLFSARSQAFAFSRNIEDLAAAKITPILPTAAEMGMINRGFGLARNTSRDSIHVMARESPITVQQGTVCSAEEASNKRKPVEHKVCVESSTFGFEVCYQIKAKNTAFIRDSPLHKTIGENAFEVSIRPVAKTPPVKKIQIEIEAGEQAGAKVIRSIRKDNTKQSDDSEDIELRGKMSLLNLRKLRNSKEQIQQLNRRIYTLRSRESRSEMRSSDSSSASSSSQESSFLRDSMSPIFVVLAQAIMSDNKKMGYQTTAYVDRMAAHPAMQLFVDELEGEGKWRACVEAEMPNEHRAMGVLKWGKDCKDYMIVAKASTGQYEYHPAMLFKLQWDRVPHFLKHASEIVAEHLPGVAFMLGFSERHQKSPSHHLSVTAAATSPRTIDLFIKTPKLALSRRAIVIPVALPVDVKSPSLQQSGFHILRELPFMILAKDECTVRENKFTPFTENSFEYKMPGDCPHILTQDCTSELKFIIMIKRATESPNSMSLILSLPSGGIEIDSMPSGDLRLFINGTEMPITRLPLPKSITIDMDNDRVIIEAAELGLEKLYFDGKRIKVVVASWMTGRTCGLCGYGDLKTRNEYNLPNGQSTKDVVKFAHSWLLAGERCSDACKLQKKIVKLEKQIKLHGQESNCFSVEPVLHCRPGCSPIKTVPVSVGFHCLPADSFITDRAEQRRFANLDQKNEDLQDVIEAHTACSCASECTKADI
uniref:Vitellogenin-like n=1 Tax=Callorhinchus milii TaxID=7868 RepID=A0A4W3HZM8_CALMI|eukprot:gi/632940646/ref/XP_007885429.1/ PREDICTED: vitellogenin-like isoform X2 [Callorhinchus milii]